MLSVHLSLVLINIFLIYNHITGFDFFKNTSQYVSTLFAKSVISRIHEILIFREIWILHYVLEE